MSYEIKQAPIGGRLGTRLGVGLSEQLPKEIERQRLSQGLQNLYGQANKLSPLEFYTRALQVPGLADRPQALQSLADIQRLQARGEALKGAYPGEQPVPQFPYPVRQGQSVNESPSLTQSDVLENAQEGFIPPTQDQIFSEAGRLYQENPARFGNDPDRAINFVESKYARMKDRAEAYQKKHADLSRLQDNVVNRLQDYSKGLGVDLPSRVYSDIEDQAIQAVKPKSQGGRGLTEQQAMKEYGKQLDEISRQYQDVDDINDWSLITNRAASKTKMRNLSREFKKRNDVRNLAGKYVNNLDVSYPVAYSLADPISNYPKLNGFINKLKPNFASSPSQVREQTQQILPKLGDLLGQAQPLAVIEALRSKGYDGSIIQDYFKQNEDKLGLNPTQVDQLNKSYPTLPTKNDLWYRFWGGIE